MGRGASVCSTPGCPNLTPCATHPPEKPWVRSKRKERVNATSGWQLQRDNQRILHRHDGICHVCGLPGATIVDHVIPTFEGGADTDDNKRPIHDKPCHADKTNAEAARARRRDD